MYTYFLSYKLGANPPGPIEYIHLLLYNLYGFLYELCINYGIIIMTSIKVCPEVNWSIGFPGTSEALLLFSTCLSPHKIHHKRRVRVIYLW